MQRCSRLIIPVLQTKKFQLVLLMSSDAVMKEVDWNWELVVTALGTREKRRLQSIEELKGEIQRVSETDPLRAIQGKIAGSTLPGSSSARKCHQDCQSEASKSFGITNLCRGVDGGGYDVSTNGVSFQLTGGGAYSIDWLTWIPIMWSRSM